MDRQTGVKQPEKVASRLLVDDPCEDVCWGLWVPPLRLRKRRVCLSSGVLSLGRGPPGTAPWASEDREATDDDWDVTEVQFGSVIWTITMGCSDSAKPNEVTTLLWAIHGARKWPCSRERSRRATGGP